MFYKQLHRQLYNENLDEKHYSSKTLKSIKCEMTPAYQEQTEASGEILGMEQQVCHFLDQGKP